MQFVRWHSVASWSVCVHVHVYVGCFNYSTCTSTKCKWDFMLDASTNSTYTTTKCKWGFERNQLQNECKVVPTPPVCTKRPLAGNLYCSPSPPLYVAKKWRRMVYLSIYFSFYLYNEVLWLTWSKIIETSRGKWVGSYSPPDPMVYHHCVHPNSTNSIFKLQVYRFRKILQ